MAKNLNDFGIVIDDEEIVNYNKVGNYDLSDYEEHRLNDFELCVDGEIYYGKPVLSDIDEVKYTNEYNEEVTEHRVRFYLINEEEEIYLSTTINLKNDAELPIVKQIHPNSKLFKLAYAIIKTDSPEIADMIPNNRKMKQVNLETLQKICENIDEMALEIVLEEGDNRIPDYNSFKYANMEDI